VIGEQTIKSGSKPIAVFEVPYEPGELKAFALKDGKEIGVKVLRTAGDPAALRLTADRDTIRADRSDLAFVAIEVVDEFGQPVDDASVTVTLEISGNGELIGSGNACPWDMASVGRNVLKTYRGRAQAIVRPFKKPGTITLKATGQKLQDGITAIGVE
jgi:beta-galactosidase